MSTRLQAFVEDRMASSRLIHLVELDGDRTFCDALKLEQLATAGFLDHDVCPECVEQLRQHWQQEVTGLVSAR